MSGRRVVILFNPVSGAGRAARAAEEVRAALVARGHDVAAVPTRREPGSLWLPAALVGREAVIVVGGDGAVRVAAEGAAAADVPLYHCPAGTENLVARHFGATAHPDAIAAALERGEVRRFDLGQMVRREAVRHGEREENEPFVLMASAGFDAEVVHSLAASRGAAITHMSYVPAIGRAIFAWRAPEVAVSVDGAAPVALGRGVLIVVNMPTYAFRINPGRGAIPDDGVLDAVFLPCRAGPGAATWAIRHVFTSGAVAGVRRIQGRRFDVVLDRPSRWQLDGDPFAPLNAVTAVSIGVRFRVLPILMPVPPVR